MRSPVTTVIPGSWVIETKLPWVAMYILGAVDLRRVVVIYWSKTTRIVIFIVAVVPTLVCMETQLARETHIKWGMIRCSSECGNFRTNVVMT